MSKYKIHQESGETKTFTDKEKFEDICQLLDDGGREYTTETPDTKSDGGTQIVDHVEGDTTENVETPTAGDMAQLAANPIEWLEGINSAYVNTIKGTPAISKRGFRYIQSQFGISTESEIVKVLDDPVGVFVWARAELPDGRYAEAHGEGYLTESRVDDNEFVRYADTRAKSRALADLTSSGALATEEMEGGS